jgi:hypothetical protein
MSNLQKYFGLSNMMIPKEGPRTVPAILDFDASGSIEIDGLLVSTMGVIGFIQGVYVDNLDNPNAFQLVCGITNQRVTCPANSQGYFTLLLPNPPDMTATLVGAVGGERVTCYFYNVPIQSGVWPSGSGGGGGTVTPSPVTFTDYSLALTGGNDGAIAAGEAARYLAIQNPVGNGDITVNIAGGNATLSGIVLEGGGDMTLESGVAGAVNIAGTAAQNVIIFGGA